MRGKADVKPNASKQIKTQAVPITIRAVVASLQIIRSSKEHQHHELSRQSRDRNAPIRGAKVKPTQIFMLTRLTATSVQRSIKDDNDSIRLIRRA